MVPDNTQSATKDNIMNESIRSSSSIMSKRALLDGQKTPIGSIISSENKNNMLPEDQEIVEDEEEDE